jgi:acetylornithine deacetylase/succinyl-diaminopimelate desuccinylase-like protein
MTELTSTHAISWLDQHWDTLLDDLCELATIAGVSAEPPPSAELHKSARAVAQLLTDAGLENVKILNVEGGHPNVYADWLHADGAPTVLLYAHHDVQPPGDRHRWESDPFVPTWRVDTHGHNRLYARGIVDDKAGVMMHVAACAAYLKTTGSLPVNVKILIEGEEEIGSPTLLDFLSLHRDQLASDVLVLTDTANLDQGVASLTTSLRGIVTVQVHVRALEKPLHSGMWGGPVPDPVVALSRAITALTDDQGVLRAEFWQGVRPLTQEETHALGQLPYQEAQFREHAGIVGDARLVGDASAPLWARVWRQPSVAVLAMQARPIEGSSNQIVDRASARISIRIVPDQDPAVMTRALADHFRTHVPWDLQTEVIEEQGAGPWRTNPEGPAFDAALRALERGYGTPAVFIGCGGTIPFVEPFTRVFAGAPALLVGLEDPRCGAHSENESLYVDDWKKGIRSLVHLLHELRSAVTPRA